MLFKGKKKRKKREKKKKKKVCDWVFDFRGSTKESISSEVCWHGWKWPRQIKEIFFFKNWYQRCQVSQRSFAKCIFFLFSLFSFFSYLSWMLIKKLKLKKYYELGTELTKPPEGFDSCHGVKNAPGSPSVFLDDEYVIYSSNQQRLKVHI